MRVRTLQLGREDGQALVMSVLFLFGIVLLLALVVNVGLWYASQRRAQAVADSVALSVAPQLAAMQSATPLGPVNSVDCSSAVAAQHYADADWQGAAATATCDFDATKPLRATVQVSHSVPGFFTSLLAAFGGITVGAQATATMEAPASLNNQDLNAIAPTPTYVAPIVIRDTACSTPPWTNCLNATPQAKFITPMDPTIGFLSIADLSCGVTGGGCQNPDVSTLADWITCGPCLGGNLAIGTDLSPVQASVINTCDPGPPVSCPIRDALASVVGKTIFAAVAAQPSVGGDFHVLGYAALRITSVPTDLEWQQDPALKTLYVQLEPYTPEPTLDNSGMPVAYGVQTIGLTG
jgi:Putative Flp pilus-assembly TadE/G-like